MIIVRHNKDFAPSLRWLLPRLRVAFLLPRTRIEMKRVSRLARHLAPIYASGGAKAFLSGGRTYEPDISVTAG